MLKTIGIVILVIVVASGAYFVGKNGFSFSLNKVTLPSPTPIVTTMPTQQTIAPQAATSTVSTTQNDQQDLVAAIKLGLVAEHGQDAANDTISVSIIEGLYAKGMANSTGGGGIWFAAKTSGNWKLIWDGNGIIDCGVLTSYPNFPTSLIPSCFDTTSNKLLTRSPRKAGARIDATASIC